MGSWSVARASGGDGTRGQRRGIEDLTRRSALGGSEGGRAASGEENGSPGLEGNTGNRDPLGVVSRFDESLTQS
ncbi:hypothetical protein [Rhodococcus koreensis]|uniref:hypothetical protein n=1 Tax=Rhodococcus koreensis TaxID=99653 RepID=UPI00366AB686